MDKIKELVMSFQKWLNKDKKNMLLLFGGIGLVLLVYIVFSNTDKRISIEEFVSYEVEGYNDFGYINVSIDELELEKVLMKNQKVSLEDFSGLNKYAEIYNCSQGYDIEIDKETQLSNGDKVSIFITPSNECKLAKGTTIKTLIADLPDGVPITDAELKEKVIVEFEGTSGNGTVRIKNLFKDDLLSIDFDSSKSEGIENGDDITISLCDDSIDILGKSGYKISETGKFVVKANGLTNIASNIDDIKNKDDVLRLLNEQITSHFNNSFFHSDYEKESALYYSQFISRDSELSNSSWFKSFDDGSVGYVIFATDRFRGAIDKGFFGFTDLALNENNEVDINNLKLVTHDFDSNYSLESIKKILEADGFKETNK